MSYYSKFESGELSPMAYKLLKYSVIILLLSFAIGYFTHIFVGAAIFIFSMLLGLTGMSLTSWWMFTLFFLIINFLGFGIYFKEASIDEKIEGFNQDLGIGILAFGLCYTVLWFAARAVETRKSK